MTVARDTWRKLNLLRRDPSDTFDAVICRLLAEHERRGAAEERRAG